MTYQVTAVDYEILPSASPAFPTSFRYVLHSVWVHYDPALLPASGGIVVAGLDSVGAAFTGLQFSSTCRGSIYAGHSQVQYGDGALHGGAASQVAIMDSDPFAAAGWAHFLWSVDTQGQVAQLYINDTSVAVSTPAAYPIDIVLPADGIMTNKILTATCYADLYLAATDSFYDLTDVANRRKFIDASGDPVFLGADGSLPTGTAPQLFLSVPPGGIASDMLVNRGSGGGLFTAYTSPALCSSSGGPFPVLPVSAEMADMYFGSPAAFFDLSVAANRRKLISSAGCPVDLGATGSLVTGAAPAAFFSVTGAGTADSFAVNRGTGGAFTLSGGDLAFSATTPCSADVAGYLLNGNVPQGADPQVMLSVSDDGGRTWSPLQKWRSMGRLGEYTKRLRWLKMGQFRQRVIKLEITDPVRRRLIGFYEDVTEGME